MKEESATAQAEAFYQKFKVTASSIEEQIDSLAGSQAQERGTITEQCLSRITQLSHEIKDAMVFLPAYDQRNYSQRVKELSERLENVRASVAPKAKFSFKGGRKGLSSRAVEERTAASTETPSEPLLTDNRTEDTASQAATVGKQVRAIVRLPVPQAVQGQSCVVLDIQRCAVVPAQDSGSLFSTMTVKHIAESALDLGTINGPVHLTGLDNCIIVMACRQFRMHQCRNCKVYLWCTSRPIIEHCAAIAFAPLPSSLLTSDMLRASENKWNQIDDFNWLRSEPSPHWMELPSEGRDPEAKLLQLRNTTDDDNVDAVLEKIYG